MKNDDYNWANKIELLESVNRTLMALLAKARDELAAHHQIYPVALITEIDIVLSEKSLLTITSDVLS